MDDDDDDDDDTYTRSYFNQSSIQPSPLLFNSSIQPFLYLSIYVSINHFAAPIAVKRHVVCATSLVIYPWNAVRVSELMHDDDDSCDDDDKDIPVQSYQVYVSLSSSSSSSLNSWEEGCHEQETDCGRGDDEGESEGVL